ncbi:MAG TPA: vWA domain-containing protein [Clostridia bacterium]|nr:vWA domain-containing protein [Clostridia bacterium]
MTFEFPWGWLLALPLLAALLASYWRQRRKFNPRHLRALTALRGAAILLLVFLAARPVWSSKEPANAASREVLLLIDKSQSMSVRQGAETRYEQAARFAAKRLVPALQSARLPVRAFLFDENAQAVDGPAIARTLPSGKRTNLGRALAQAMENASEPPLAVIALTDGIVNDGRDNNRALTSLIVGSTPFIGVGFGDDRGTPTLALTDLTAPPLVSPKSSFTISANLEVLNPENSFACELLLFRDGQLHQTKAVSAGLGSRTWIENFKVSEDSPGTHTYSVRLVPPEGSRINCVNAQASAAVRISDQKELRVLFIQGALTWDYKFINLALREDKGIKLTGLTRTSKQSVFRQNVEHSGELLHGFPSSLQELAPFRLVVLSNLRATDLTPGQQDTLARFCSELGGGVLLMGGPSSFDSSWRNSRLEQLLPVVFAPQTGVQGLDRPFQLQLTEEALQLPAFQITESDSSREAWAQLPAFSQYGRVDTAKAGAQIWARHSQDRGPEGNRILMACQRYGAGLSAILTIQNFWRWRLAENANTEQYDRFWRQLFRFLSEVGRPDVAIHLTDQELHPDRDVRLTLERQPLPGNLTETTNRFLVRVEDTEKKAILQQSLSLEPLRPVDFQFHASQTGTYTVVVADHANVPLASRPVEIRNINVELQNTARSMETLDQWASVTGGLAVKAEECPAASDLITRIKGKIETVRQAKQFRAPAGVNVWVFAAVLGCLGGEWFLRKRWGMI